MPTDKESSATLPHVDTGSFRAKLGSIYRSNPEVRQFIEAAFGAVEEQLGRPATLQWISAAETRSQVKLLGGALALIHRYQHARAEGSEKETHRLGKQVTGEGAISELISRASQSLFGESLSVSRGGAVLTESGEEPTEEIEDWLCRRLVMAEGLHEAYQLGFACKILGRYKMPPFRADADLRGRMRDQKRREQLAEECREADHPLVEKLSRLAGEPEAEKPEAEKPGTRGSGGTKGTEENKATPAELRALLKGSIGAHLERLSREHHQEFSRHVESYAQLAETDRERFEAEAERLIAGAQALGEAAGLSAGIQLAPTPEEEGTYEKGWRETPLGAEWSLERGPEDLEAFRKQIRKAEREKELRLYAWQRVWKSLCERGDPREALLEPATETVRNLTTSQRSRLKALHRTLLMEEKLRFSKKNAWKRCFNSLVEKNFVGPAEGESFGACRKAIERGAAECFGVEKKSDLPDQYQGYKSGGFAQLIEDLWDGSWTRLVSCR